MPPPIRYPLPTLILALLFALAAWRGAGWVEGARRALASRWERAVEGPPVPASSSPRVVAGPMVRRALLLHDDTPVSTRPGALPTDAIARRSFVDIYDIWPTDGPATHLRVGTRRPIGWIAAADALPWDTRLVARAERLGPIETGGVPSPVVGWRGDELELTTWDRGHPWSVVGPKAWERGTDLPPGSLGVLLAREELPALLALALSATDEAGRDRVRLRAVLGRLVEPADWPADRVAAARAALPPRVFDRPASSDPSDRIAALNAEAKSDASWGGHDFRFVPLEDLP